MVDKPDVRPNRPMRILHCLNCMVRGGVEVWLMNVLRHMDRSAFQFDFAVNSSAPGVFDDEIRSYGGRIFVLNANTKRPWTYDRELTALLQDAGPFDVVHSHLHLYSGYVLRVAARSGVPVRIAHSHNDVHRLYRPLNLPRQGYRWLMRRWLGYYATGGLACSRIAAISLFGEKWLYDPRWQLLPYGIDFSPYVNPTNSVNVRSQLGIPAHRVVIGQVGRLVSQKNHIFALRVIRELVQIGVDAHYLVIGDGPMQDELVSRIQKTGLGDRVTLAGDQANVVPFYAIMDFMVFPSLYEGLGIVVLEAQAAGVPTLASFRVPPEVEVIPDLVSYLSLMAGPKVWAYQICKLLQIPRPARQDAVLRMNRSKYIIQRSVEQLCETYSSARSVDAVVSSLFDNHPSWKSADAKSSPLASSRSAASSDSELNLL